MFHPALRSTLSHGQSDFVFNQDIIPTAPLLLHTVNPRSHPVQHSHHHKMLCLKLLVLVILASHNILASSPTPWQIQTTIAARSFDGASVHLVDCHPRDPEEGANPTQTWISLVIVRFQVPHQNKYPR